jgi:hypothetical protein
MSDDAKRGPEKTDAPAQYRTVRRPGQPGDAAERQDGPSPRSDHPTGPHAPYEPHDPNGLAAAKHVRNSDPSGSNR